MAATNKFKNWMAAKLSTILRREIAPDEITLGPVFPATGTKTSMVEITYDGEKYPIVYDKFPITELFGGLSTCPVTVRGEPTTYIEALKLINERMGLSISDTDVYPFNVGASYSTLFLEFTPSCYEYTGKLNINLEWTGDYEFPKPLHEWLLQENLDNTGESPVALTGPITHFENADGKWGSLGGTGHIPLPAGAELARPGDYTLDFEVYFDAIRSYTCVLTTNKAVAGAPGSMWWYGGKCYEYGVSSGTAAIPVAKARTPHRITLVRKSGSTTMYIDGVMAQTYVGGNNLPFVGFRDADRTDYQIQPTDGLRNLRFWGRALSSGELKTIFKKPPVPIPQPLHLFELDGDSVNSGTDTNPMTMEFNYHTEYGRIWGIRKRGGGELLGSNVKFEFNHDAVLDFEVFLAPGSDYRMLFTPDQYVMNAGGALMMYANRIYHAGIGYSGLADIMARQALPNNQPVRITKRLKSGTMYVYVNGLLYMSYPFTLAKPYNAIGDIDTGCNPMAAPNRIRAIQYWPTALTDAEFTEVLKVAPANYPKPTHQFLLDGNDDNSGQGKTSLGMALSYEKIGTAMYAKRTGPDREQLATVFKMSGDYVFDVVLYATSFAYQSVLFSPSSGNPANPYIGAMMFYGGKFYHAHMGSLGTPVDSRPAMKAGAPNRITIRKKGNAITVFQNGVEITSYTSPVIGDYDAFGTAGYESWKDTGRFRAIRYWEGPMSDEEFMAIMANNI